MSICFKDLSLFEMRKGGLLSRWSTKWRASFHTIDMEELLAVDCTATGILTIESRIVHLGASSGGFAPKPFGLGTIIGYYYGSLESED